MKKIFKTLGKQAHVIILILVLLVIQAYCDLSLPGYTSDIVNIGIQQKGVKDTVFEVIRESEYKKILLFTDEKDKKLIENNYRKLNKDKLSRSEYEEYLEKYPSLAEENLYVLKEVDEAKHEEINETLNKPVALYSALSSDSKEMKDFKKSMNVKSNEELFQMLLAMPEVQLKKITEEFDKKFDKLESSIITQMDVKTVQKEYKSIGIDVDKIQISFILSTGIKMILIAFLNMIIMIIVAYLASKTGAKFSKELRRDVVHKVMDFSEQEMKDFSTASLITRSTNDIQQVQMLVIMVLRMLLYAPVLGIGAFTKVTGSQMGWVIGVAVLAIIVLVGVLFGIALPKFKILQKLVDKLNLVSRETLTGLPVVRSFSNEKYEEKRFDDANIDLTKANLFVNRIMAIMMPTMMFIMNGVSVLIIWVGASKIDAGSMQVGTLLAFITYTMQIIMSFLMLSMISIILPRALVSARRIGEVFNKKVSVKNPEVAKEFKKDLKGVVEFKDVYFRYPDAEEDVLQNISFTASAGTTTAFIGSTGAGKSTLINLIPRFFDVTGGKILVDGVNIKEVDVKSLREKIGFVPQKGNLFTGTIKSNIGFADENLSEEEIKEASIISEAYDFIDDKPEKFDTEISEGGTNVSGGQKQRLSIARAIAKKPEIIIFDDSFSALDYKTDSVVRKNISKKLKNSTIFIVAQRISTIMNADKIVVIDEGRVVGIGKHKELMKNCAVYKEIALSQLSKEELS